MGHRSQGSANHSYDSDMNLGKLSCPLISVPPYLYHSMATCAMITSSLPAWVAAHSLLYNGLSP